MASYVWIGFVAFFVVSLIVGVRLVLLWRRTRQQPELLIGIGVLGIGPVGYGLTVVGQLAGSSSPAVGRTILAIGMFAVGTGVVAKYVFNWRVYHPSEARLKLLAWIAAGVLVGAWIHSAWVSGFADVGTIGARYVVRQVLQVGCLLWGSIEALRYWTLMRKRVPLGLADPVVANRFLLWGIGAGAAGLGSFIGCAAQVIVGSPMLETSWVMASSSLHGMVAAVALSLAFMPPEAYRRFVSNRARARSATS
jgi:hypothetical protein